MKLSFDQTTDFSHKELYQYLAGKSIPSFVKEAEMEDEESLNKLKTSAFAAEYYRAYPIHTPTATFLSNAFFVNKKAALIESYGSSYVSRLETKLKQAAEQHNIVKECDQYTQEYKQAQSKDYTVEYMFSGEAAGKRYNLFPVKTAEDLKKQAALFTSKIDNLLFDWRCPTAVNFVKKAKALGIDELPDLVCKYAGYFYPDFAGATDKLLRRANRIKDAKVKEEYTALAKIAVELEDKEDFMQLAKKAHELEIKDQVFFRIKKADYHEDIVDSLFSLSIEKVAEMLDFVDVGGNRYKLEDLQKVSSDIYKQAFDIDLDPKNAEQLRDVMPTVPLTDMHLFRELSGVKPI